MWRSVPQIEAASTRISTSPGPGWGTGSAASSAPGCGPVFRRARILDGSSACLMTSADGRWFVTAPGSRPKRPPHGFLRDDETIVPRNEGSNRRPKEMREAVALVRVRDRPPRTGPARLLHAGHPRFGIAPRYCRGAGFAADLADL